MLDLSITSLSKSLGYVFVPRHTYISLGGGYFRSCCVPTKVLVLFWHFPAPETLSDDLVCYLFVFTKSFVKEVVYFHFSLDNQAPLPGIPDRCMALGCTCLIQGRDRVAASARENYSYWGCKTDELLNIFKGNFTHNSFNRIFMKWQSFHSHLTKAYKFKSGLSQF